MDSAEASLLDYRKNCDIIILALEPVRIAEAYLSEGKMMLAK